MTTQELIDAITDLERGLEREWLDERTKKALRTLANFRDVFRSGDAILMLLGGDMLGNSQVVPR